MRRLLRFGLFHALFRVGHRSPVVLVLVLLGVAFAIFMAIRTSRRGR